MNKLIPLAAALSLAAHGCGQSREEEQRADRHLKSIIGVAADFRSLCEEIVLGRSRTSGTSGAKFSISSCTCSPETDKTQTCKISQIIDDRYREFDLAYDGLSGGSQIVVYSDEQGTATRKKISFIGEVAYIPFKGSGMGCDVGVGMDRTSNKELCQTALREVAGTISDMRTMIRTLLPPPARSSSGARGK